AFDVEGDRATLDFGDRDLQLDRHAHQGRREVVELDARADRVLAGVEVLEQQLAAGDLDVLHQHRRRIDARVLAHESDRAVAIDGELAGPRGAGGEGRLHGFLRVRIEVGGRGSGQAGYRP